MSIVAVSVKKRLLVAVGSNGVRAALSFATGLLIARALLPAAYGDLMYLLASFIAIRPLLDLGGSTAFFTFLSQRARGPRFYLRYFAWLGLQFTVALLLVAVLIPDDVFARIWLGYDRGMVVLACVAAFLQQQVWQTVGQIGEASRNTMRVQLLNMIVAVCYLLAVGVLAAAGAMSVTRVLWILIVQYTLVTLFALRYLRHSVQGEDDGAPLAAALREYWVYCKPLIALSVISFMFDFVDKWLLQRFGGAAQQGFFQIANQFSAISLLATASILNIFWKEIAAAWAEQDFARVARLYRRVNRGLVMLGAAATGLLMPWAREIVTVVLGPSYLQAWPVLAIMLLYPIHQSMGQIGGTMLYASGQTKKYMWVSAAVMLLSIPISYLMLAPRSGVLIPGLGLEAIGMALKMVLVGVISVNIQAWVIARSCGWKLDWQFQLVGIAALISAGYLAKLVVTTLWPIAAVTAGALLVPVLATAFLYTCFVIAIIYALPWLIGMERAEISAAVVKLRNFLKSRNGIQACD